MLLKAGSMNDDPAMKRFWLTLLEEDLVGRLGAKCKEINVPSLSIIGPVMQLLEAVSAPLYREI